MVAPCLCARSITPTRLLRLDISCLSFAIALASDFCLLESCDTWVASLLALAEVDFALFAEVVLSEFIDAGAAVLAAGRAGWRGKASAPEQSRSQHDRVCPRACSKDPAFGWANTEQDADVTAWINDDDSEAEEVSLVVRFVVPKPTQQ